MKFGIRDRIRYMNMFHKYLLKYGSEYSELSREFISKNFLKITEPGYTPDILLQLYAKFGMLSDEENIYLRFADMIGETYGWNYNILEVGGGYYPIFSKYIADKQQKHAGTITTVDPHLVVSKLGNVKLQKREFSYHEDISNFDLIMGICPCDATLDIIKSAKLNHREFFIAMCGCTHFTFENFPYIYDPNTLFNMWKKFVIDLAIEQEEDGFEVTTEEVSFFPYPIIKSKIKK